MPDQVGGYRILCQPEEDAVLTDYLQELARQGFEPTTSLHIASLNPIYGKGEWYVLLNQTSN